MLRVVSGGVGSVRRRRPKSPSSSVLPRSRLLPSARVSFQVLPWVSVRLVTVLVPFCFVLPRVEAAGVAAVDEENTEAVFVDDAVVAVASGVAVNIEAGTAQEDVVAFAAFEDVEAGKANQNILSSQSAQQINLIFAANQQVGIRTSSCSPVFTY